ncbi:MAG: redoxin domain-containing protein, partial [Planctomycetaceae bacterium]
MTACRLPILITMSCLGCGGFSALYAAPSNPVETQIGHQVPDFVLPDSSGRQVALSDFNDARFLIVVFLGTECPIGNAYIPVLNDLQTQFQDKSVQVLGVNSNLSDTAESIRAHVQTFQVDFPVLIDRRQVVADLFDARRTPEAFLLDRRRHIRYRGRIDDRFGLTYKREKPRRHDLVEAVTEQLAGQAPTIVETEPAGCLITRRDRLENRDTITFAKHVSRILQARCANCHHPGTAAPFSLLDYEQARDRAAMIRETVVQRRMPPWSADPRHGRFSNDLRLSETELDTLVAWVDNGSPQGNPDDLPAPVEYAAGWTIGKPDVVLTMPRSYTVPATGTVKYQYFVTPTNFKED